MAITYKAVRIPHTPPSVLPAAGERRRGTIRGQERGWVSGLGMDVVVKEGDAGERCRSVWPSLSCLGLELAAAASVSYVVANNDPWYYSCPANETGCKAKVVPAGDKWHCEKLNTTFATKTNRYILKLTIVDSTGSKFCTAFDDRGDVLSPPMLCAGVGIGPAHAKWEGRGPDGRAKPVTPVQI